MNSYEVSLEKFEGPLDLLIHLIQKNKIDIYDIPIAEITNQYLAHIEKWRELDMEVASEFCGYASAFWRLNPECFCQEQRTRKKTKKT